jgi:hypothetical protein
MTELAARLAAIRHALVIETEANPSQVLAYGRPHTSARARYFPRYTHTGVQLAGSVRVPPDCPKPIKGRCECQPDGAWRPAVGARRADDLAHTAEVVDWPGGHTCDASHPNPCPMFDRMWTNALYVQRQDGQWVCVRPMRAALERLRRQSLRRYLVVDRLFAGQSLKAAWAGLGNPDLPQATMNICRDLEAWAREEELAEYIRRPNYWRVTPRPSFLEKSEAQVNAEDAA